PPPPPLFPPRRSSDPPLARVLPGGRDRGVGLRAQPLRRRRPGRDGSAAPNLSRTGVRSSSASFRVAPHAPRWARHVVGLEFRPRSEEHTSELQSLTNL